MLKVEACDKLSPYAVSKAITCSLIDLTDHSLRVNEYLAGNALILLGSCCYCDIEQLAKKLATISMTHDFKTKDYEFTFEEYSLFTRVNYPYQDISQMNLVVSKDSSEIIIHVRGKHGYRKNTYMIATQRGGKNGWRMTYTGFIHENLSNSRRWAMYDRMIIQDPCMIVNRIMYTGFTRLQYHGEIEKLLSGDDSVMPIDILGLFTDASKHMITSQKNNLMLLFHADKVKPNQPHLKSMAPFTQLDDTREKKMAKNMELCLTNDSIALVSQRVQEAYDNLTGGQPQKKRRKQADPEYNSDEWVLDESYPVVSDPKTNNKLMLKIMFFEIEKIVKQYFWCTSNGIYPITRKNGKNISCIDSSDKFTPEQICHCAIRHVDHMTLGVHKESCFLCQRAHWSEHRGNQNAEIFFQYMSPHLIRCKPEKTLFSSVDWQANEDGIKFNDNIIVFSSWDNRDPVYFDFVDQSILNEEEMKSHKWFAAHNKLQYRIPKGINLSTLSLDIKDEGFYENVVKYCRTLPHMYSQSSAITKMILLMFGLGLAKMPHQIFFMLVGNANMGKSEIKRILQECISDSRKVRHMDNGIHAGNFGISMLAGDKETCIVTFDEIPSKSFNHTQLLQSVDRFKLHYNRKGDPDAQEGTIPFMVWACNEFFPWPIKDSVLRRCGVIDTEEFVRQNIYPSPVQAILSDDHEVICFLLVRKSNDVYGCGCDDVYGISSYEI